jgi:hypothetical protein
MAPDDQPTCGKGIAANAVLPAKLAELTAATAEVLERHTKALDLTDPAAREEREAYVALVRAHRAIAGEPGATDGWLPRPADGPARRSGDGRSRRTGRSLPVLGRQ